MPFTVMTTKSVDKNINKLPENIKKKFVVLVEDLHDKGPILKNWKNFSEIGKNKYHCHLGYHWVACWRFEKKSIVIEVYYAGSREKAPY
jgi:mRNA-degrading endonuclease RelE of RelBE toxin-antitoxin system